MANVVRVSEETAPIHLVHRLMRTAERRGYDVVPLLEEAGLSLDVADNPRTRVTAASSSGSVRGSRSAPSG